MSVDFPAVIRKGARQHARRPERKWSLAPGVFANKMMTIFRVFTKAMRMAFFLWQATKNTITATALVKLTSAKAS